MWRNGLRIWCFHCCGSRHCCDVGSVPGLGTSHAAGMANKQTNKQTKTKKVKIAPIEWRELFATHICEKRVISIISREHLHVINEKTGNPIF